MSIEEIIYKGFAVVVAYYLFVAITWLIGVLVVWGGLAAVAWWLYSSLGG